MKINLTVILKSKPEYAEELKLILEKMVANSRRELTCVQYDLHQNLDNPNIFIFHEVWKNEEGFEIHKKQSYIQEFNKVSKVYLDEKPILYRTSKIA
jgi:quinol monooxygenase YgiN